MESRPAKEVAQTMPPIVAAVTLLLVLGSLAWSLDSPGSVATSAAPTPKDFPNAHASTAADVAAHPYRGAVNQLRIERTGTTDTDTTGPLPEDCLRDGVTLCVSFERNNSQFACEPDTCSATDSRRAKVYTLNKDGSRLAWSVENNGFNLGAMNPRADDTDRISRVARPTGGGNGGDGSHALRIGTKDDDGRLGGGNERSEMSLDGRETLGVDTSRRSNVEGLEQWWAHSLFLPADFPLGQVGGVLLQFHMDGGTVCGDGRQHFELSIRRHTNNVNDKLWFFKSSGWGAAPGNENCTQYHYRHTPSSQWRFGRCLHENPQLNVWYEFVHHIRWSDSGNGFHRIYMRVGGGRPKKVLDKSGISTLFKGAMPRLKIGFYHDPIAAPARVIHDRLRRGSSFAAVQPSGFVLPSQSAPEEKCASVYAQK